MSTSAIVDRESWLRHARAWAQLSMAGQGRQWAHGIIPAWFKNREIRIMWERSVSHATVHRVALAIRERVRELDLPEFDIQLWGTGWDEGGRHVSVRQYIDPALRSNGSIDYLGLFRLSHHEVYRQQRQHADVYITTRQFDDDVVSCGASGFEHGTMVFTLHGDRQRNADFLHSVARHETAHLFGMIAHCDDYPHIRGYTYDPGCNMHYACPTSTLCRKCLEFIQTWWNTVQSFSG